MFPDELILNDNENISYEKLKPIIYDSIKKKTYQVVGEVVGQAFSEGLKINNE